jgi:hypothetical protein
LTLLSPVVFALAETASAVAELVCAAFAFVPGLPILTETLRLVGFVCVAVAVDAGVLCVGAAVVEGGSGFAAVTGVALGQAPEHWSRVWSMLDEFAMTAGASVLLTGAAPAADTAPAGSRPDAVAAAVFVCVTPSAPPALATLTETLTFTGDVWLALAAGAAVPAAASCPADACAVAAFAWFTEPSPPGLFTRTERLTLEGVFWSALPFACVVAFPFPAFTAAAPDAETPFDWSTGPFPPA